MAENWLERTVNVPGVIDEIIKKYTEKGINKLTGSVYHKDAQAAMALALNDALNQTSLSRRKRRAVGLAMIEKVMTGAAIVFMLGYDQARREADDAK